MLDKGGYTVHPVPTPTSTRAELSRSNSDGGSSQKLMLFSRGQGHVGRTDHDGHKPVPKPTDEGGHHHEEDHEEGMGRDQHIVDLVVPSKDLRTWLRQLHTDK